MSDKNIPSGTLSPISLKIDLDPRINFAMQQNDVPVVRSVYVENFLDLPLRDLLLRITSDPNFAEPFEARIDHIGEKSTYKLDAVDIILSYQYLSGLTERVRGQFRFEIFQDEVRLFEQNEIVELFARDEWTGLTSLPEILAAFAMPNHPAVERILRQAADILNGWTRDPSLSGYQTKDPKRVYTITGAVYSALQGTGITYVNPPASFEASGQRIRLPDRILESRLATCLDLAVLTAGCLEQAGLNPLIVVVRGHAFVGVWLQEECFGEPAIDDPLRLRKRVELDEITVFDPTCITVRPLIDFSGSVREAKRRLEKPEELLCIIDLTRARKGKIRPLPEQVERPVPSSGGEIETTEGGAPPAPDASSLHTPTFSTSVVDEETTETPVTRLNRWRRKLLDLTLRNRLLNFRETKKTIPLLCPSLASFEDALAGGAIFNILSRPKELDGGDPRDPEVHRRRTGEEAILALLTEQLRSKRLHADLTSEELDRRLIEVYREARTDIEEGGANALYLAIGFLTWYETDQSTQRRNAPILLLPIELQRRSVREGFSLRLGEDEPQINVTLLELLKQDFGVNISGLDPLPEDESGYDVPKILRIFRESVRDINKWEVIDLARIGIFSFAKFLMWRDLTVRADDLMKNPVVEHLVNRSDQVFDPDAIFPREDSLDEDRSPLSTFCPLPADSSQLAAVFAAAENRSFVLEGPPGTGKSQTITNLISHCLAEGKTVLFVSEKMAALNVVHDRLKKVSLGRYCLELHSNKTHKSEVLGRLDDSLRYHEIHTPETWEREAKRLAILRNELNAYVKALHKRRETGETVFQATSRLIGLRDVPPVDLCWSSNAALETDQLDKIRDLVERIATAGKSIGEVAGQPWGATGRSDWTPAWEQDVHTALNQLRGLLLEMEVRAREVSKRTSLGEGGWSLDELDVLDSLAGILLDSPAPPPEILLRPDWNEIQSQIANWIEHGMQRDTLRADVYERFSERILNLDLDSLHVRYQQANSSSWPTSWFHRWTIRKSLKSVSKSGKAPAIDELGKIIGNARLLLKEEKALAATGDEARALLGRYWKDGEAEWVRVGDLRNWAREFRLLATRAAGGDYKRATDFREQWARIATEGHESLNRDGAIGRELVSYRTTYENFREALNKVNNLLDVDAVQAWGKRDGKDTIGMARRTLRGWGERASQLRDWCAWRRARAEGIHANLGTLIEAYERGAFPSKDLRRIFDRSYYQWWHTSVVSSDPVLSQFFSPEHERRIEQFRELDERFMKLTRELISARLAARIPSSSAVDLPNSEVGILKREIGKKTRRMPARKLFQTIPNLLVRLKPCLLMSPMSVAQYLDSKYPPFDVVVFDEASQIPIWDAVGAIARGKQAVIVGDPKQLPPTTFFQRGDDEEEEATEAETVEDLESILDDCISARLRQLSLDWHYRSRHESLIAFSNYHYYDNRLLTFPSPYREGMGVSCFPVVGGVYDRGKSATNRAEADAVVKEIVRRLKDQVLRQWSIGVVTFNQAQQTLIEDLLEEVRRADPEVDGFFSEDRHESVFVKNLENVQGDERDVILFSICFGADAAGRVSMNFGPMNRDGGERRLNVAITRARREVMVFSTLRADQIDLSRTRARGVRDLKNFLEYSERGSSAIHGVTKYVPDMDYESPFEKAVGDVLTNKGWEIHKQIGCANYRIDLAVVDPEAKGRYLLGIECDGANYHRAKTARDRDKLREGVLRDLGWELHRIWSTDWWTNPEQEIKKLEATLAAVKTRQKSKYEKGNPPPTSTPGRIAGASIFSVEAIPPNPSTSSSLISDHPIYTPYPVGPAIGNAEEYYLPTSASKIRKVIVDVVCYEGPISIRLTTRRVAAHWGLTRIREKAVGRIRGLIPKDGIRIVSSSDGMFLWPTEKNPDRYAIFRVPGLDPESAREAEDLPLHEVANAALYLLTQHISAPEEEIIREVSRLFGFRRTGTNVQDRMHAGLSFLVRKGQARLEGATMILAETPLGG